MKSVDEKVCERSLASVLIGRSFVHPLFDYLLIGGGLSLLWTVVLILSPGRITAFDMAVLPYFLLLSNSAHFASSTVRLYTKPGTRETLPFLTMAFPLVVMIVLAGSLCLAGSLGPHLTALYLTWSPYHYAAQAYGLALVYAYRSGCHLLPGDKKLLWWACLQPVIYSFLGDQGSGLHWLLPANAFANPQFNAVHTSFIKILPYVGFSAALFTFVKIARSTSGPLPIISVLMLVTNGVWWYVLPQDAFVWATVFHGIQYLAIVSIFHIRDQLARPDNRRGRLYHLAWFYSVSLLLGYALFSCLPWGFVAAGFGMIESIFLVVVAVNIHHFIVDAYIWRLKKADGNRKIVDSGVLPAT